MLGAGNRKKGNSSVPKQVQFKVKTSESTESMDLFKFIDSDNEESTGNYSPSRLKEKMLEDREFKIKYGALPDKVQYAIKLAQKKKKHSDFYYKLDSVNEKIKLYAKIFKV